MDIPTLNEILNTEVPVRVVGPIILGSYITALLGGTALMKQLSDYNFLRKMHKRGELDTSPSLLKAHEQYKKINGEHYSRELQKYIISEDNPFLQKS